MTDQVRALLLAGGESRRMGTCKQALVLAGKPVIVHCVDALIDAGVVEITVVVGKYGNTIRSALGNLEVCVVENVLLLSSESGFVQKSLRQFLTAILFSAYQRLGELGSGHGNLLISIA